MVFSVKSILAKIISRQISSNIYGFRPRSAYQSAIDRSIPIAGTALRRKFAQLRNAPINRTPSHYARRR